MAQNELEKVLARVSQGRRAFLRTMLIGSAVAVVPVMTSQSMAQGTPPNCDDGYKPNKDGTKCVKPKKKKEEFSPESRTR